MANWPDLGNPVPKERPESWRPVPWPQGDRLLLDTLAPTAAPAAEIDQFLRTRRTERTMGPISDAELGTWLDLGCRVQLIQVRISAHRGRHFRLIVDAVSA